MKRFATAFLFCTLISICLPAQTFNNLFDFQGTDGANSQAALVQGTDGNLYGTTYAGGNGSGTVFRIVPEGTQTPTTLYEFCSQPSCADGYAPSGPLILVTDGNFYGTTYEGYGAGNNGDGTIFKITPSGKLTTLYNFSGTDGANPLGALIQAADGNLYGTTYAGGANEDGTVFKITLAGRFTSLHSFTGPDGAYPSAGLVAGIDDTFYGTTAGGGTGNYGTVFRITSGGSVTSLHSFNDTDGSEPQSALVQSADGSFYGTTLVGGDTTCNAYGCGTIFRITPAGKFTTLHTFMGADGEDPRSLIQATDGNFYGVTGAGGGSNQSCFNGCGTVFEFSLTGSLITEFSFNSTDGAEPVGGLVQATNGMFYGTSFAGGDLTCAAPNGCGTAFSLSTGLGPFVTALPGYGKVGQTVRILGTELKGTASVTFNGVAAAFTVVKPSLITATIPTGATTGLVRVTTPSGTFVSNLPFKVR